MVVVGDVEVYQEDGGCLCVEGVGVSVVAGEWAQAMAAGDVQNFQDPNFEEKVRDIVGLYVNPPDGEVVVSVDAKAGIQALNRTQPPVARHVRQDREAYP